MENMSKDRYTVVELLGDDPLLVYGVGSYDFLTAVGISYMRANERIAEMEEASAKHQLYEDYQLTPIECMEGDEDFIISLKYKAYDKDEYEVDRQYALIREHCLEENKYFPDMFDHPKKEGE